MATTHEYEVVIVGAGPAGMCAALYTGRSMLRTVVLERGMPGGELLNTEKLDDWIGEKSILGWELAQKFEEHARLFGAHFVTANVTTVRRTDDGTFETITDAGEVYTSPAVIVTAGGTPIKLGIPGEAEYAGKGVSYCAICDGAFFRDQRIAVVGGGDAAVEEADFLTRYASKVYVVHRRDSFRASKILQERLFGAHFVTANVTTVRRTDDGTFETITDAGEVYTSPAVIVTAGGTPIKLGIPGEAEYAGKGVSYCAICDGAFFRDQRIAVVGGGDAAVEEADFLTRYASKVYVVHRRDSFRASKILQERLFANPKIEVVWNTVAEEVEGDEQGLVKALRLRNLETDAVSSLDVNGCFVFIGFRPNTGIIDSHFDHDPMGYIVTDGMMQTSIPGLFAAGDLRSQLTRQVTTAVGDATTAAIAVEKYLKARREGDRVVDPLGSGGYAV